MRLAPIKNLERKSKWIMDFHFCRRSKSGFFEVEFLLVLCFTFCRLLLAEDQKKKKRERNSPWKLRSVCQSSNPDNQVFPERDNRKDNLIGSIQDWNDIEEQGRENKILNVSYIAYSIYKSFSTILINVTENIYGNKTRDNCKSIRNNVTLSHKISVT